MASDDRIQYRYLNLANRWPSFTLNGLIIAKDGVLTLPLLPQQNGTIGGVPPIEALSGPAGLGVDSEGNLYIADPAGNRVLRWDACSQTSQPLPCFGGVGSLPGQLQSPRGVLIGPRHGLYVADSGNHRIQVIDLPTLQLRAIWGQPDPYALPQPGTAPGRFDTPYDLAADGAGAVYVVDHGNKRVQKFDAEGRVQPQFATTLQAQPVIPREPTYIATAVIEGEERLLILDRQAQKALVYGTDGVYDASRTALWEALPLQQPAGILFVDNVLYVGDAATGVLLTFDANGTFLGAASGFSGIPVGLVWDRQGRLLAHTDGGGITVLLPGQAYAPSGSFVAGPLSVNHAPAPTDPPTRWYRLLAHVEGLDSQTHLQCFTCTLPAGQTPPPLPSVPPLDGTETTAQDIWRAAPRDQSDFLILNAPATCLWVGGILTSQGAATPRLSQIRVEFGPPPWLDFLPAIYRSDDTTSDFLQRLLGLFGSFLSDEEAKIADLPLLFDVNAAPATAAAPWLDWLAGWLDFDLQETWSEPQRRQILAEAFALYGMRGTPEGLGRLIALYAGVTARIEEPYQTASLWSLGDMALGFDTMLVPGAAEGAIVGTTAVLDHALLLPEEDFGAPLFEDVAHCFHVQVYGSDVSRTGTLAKVTQVLDKEKPAHLAYHLCVIEPQMRVGFQARIGVDAIVGGPAPPLALTETQQLGLDTVLSNKTQDGQTLRLIGEARLGDDTKLT